MILTAVGLFDAHFNGQLHIYVLACKRLEVQLERFLTTHLAAVKIPLSYAIKEHSRAGARSILPRR